MRAAYAPLRRSWHDRPLLMFAGLAAGLVGGIAGAFGQKSANSANSAQSQRQMDFQERMSNTAHQREVEDLSQAGLNPLLSVNKGASSPGGAQAQMGNIGKAGVESAASAMQIKNLKETNSLLKSQTTGQDIKNSQEAPGGKIGDWKYNILDNMFTDSGREDFIPLPTSAMSLKRQIREPHPRGRHFNAESNQADYKKKWARNGG